MKCPKCLENKEKYDFVLPSEKIISDEMCRKCHHEKMAIDDEDYKHYIEIYRGILHLKDSTIFLAERSINAINNNEIRAEGEVSDESMLEFCEESLEIYEKMIRVLDSKINNIEEWAKLVKKIS